MDNKLVEPIFMTHDFFTRKNMGCMTIPNSSGHVKRIEFYKNLDCCWKKYRENKKNNNISAT